MHRKKTWIILLLVAADIAIMIHSCAGLKTIQDENNVKKYFFQKTDSLLYSLSILDSIVLRGAEKKEIQNQFAKCRFFYKRIEAVTEYYFQGLTKRINGPALPDVKTEDGQVWPPHGLQVIEQHIFSDYNNSLADSVSKEIKLLQTDLQFVKANMHHDDILPQHLQELLQHELIRIAALGITGFDAPLSKLSLQEARESLLSISELIEAYGKKHNGIDSLANKAVSYLAANNNFDTFNRLEFLCEHLVPLSREIFIATKTEDSKNGQMVKPFDGTLADWLIGKAWNADYYSSYARAASNADKIVVGKKLFFDKKLSRSGKISCGSCHQPNLYYTDGEIKAVDLVHGGSLLRNTPTLYYSALQSNQFYDLRSTTLEDQVNDVMKSSHEFDFEATSIAKKLFTDSVYASLFRKAFSIQDTISGFDVRNAIGAFVRSLSPFSSRFDEYVQGNKAALSENEITGFNLFTGKAKCATCHFIPLFNGNIPPWYSKSESEIIGVPLSVKWNDATIDSDSGRYRVNPMQELLYAFKTPGIRNVEKTAPYMHNGVYKTLDEVVEFYHKGGGAGIGINLPFQSLPFDSLSLNVVEKKAIIAFMQSLTDKNVVY
jgi:cytochrome c peroxidase